MRSCNYFSGVTSWRMQSARTIKILVVLLALLPLAGWGQTASSEAYGSAVDVQLNVAGMGFDEAILPPSPRVSGQGSSSYGPFDDNFTGGVSMDTLNVLVVDMGILSASTAYDAAARSVTAEGLVEDTYILAVIPTLADLVIQADGLISQSEIAGTCDDLQINASSTLLNTQLTVGDENLGIAENPPPNTVMDLSAFGLTGVSIILNEQTISGDGLHDLSVVTNAMRIVFTVDLPVVQLTGDIVLGSSSTAISDCASADISINLSAAPDPVTEGENLTHIISVNNAGPDTATNLVINDLFASALSIDSVTASPGTSCTLTGQQLTCDIASLDAASTANVVVITTPVVPGQIVNTAVVTQAIDDPDTSNNSASTTTQVDPAVPTADLGMALTGSSASVDVGEALSYSIQVNNSGPDEATGVVINDTVPAELMIESINASPGTNCSQSGQQVSCSAASIPASASVVVTIETTAATAGTITNTANVSQDAADPDPSNNQASVTTRIDPIPEPQADLHVQFSPPLPESAERGQLHEIFVIMINQGPAVAEQPLLDFDLPMTANAEQVFTDNNAQCSVSQFNVTCLSPDMSSGEQTNVRIIVELDIPGGDQTFTATVSSPTSDPDPSDNIASDSIDITEKQ